MGRNFHPAIWSDWYMRSVIPTDSLLSRYVVTSHSCPEYGRSLFPIDFTCASVNCRSASAAFNRAVSLSASAARSFACAICKLKPSAFLRAFSAATSALADREFSSAACCSIWAARSFVSADCFRASSASRRAAATSASAICCNCSASCEILLPNWYSPTTPPRTSTPNKMLRPISSLFSRASFSKMKWATYSPSIPTATAIVETPDHQLYVDSNCSNVFLSTIYAPYYSKRFFDTAREDAG